MSERAGRYVLQPGGHRAFMPRSLPPEPALHVTPDLMNLLSQADQALGRLDGAAEILPHPDLFVFMFVRKEAVLSSEIEGTRATLIDLLEYEVGNARPGTAEDAREVVNYIEAMNHGLARMAEIPISQRLIREIHAKLMQGTRGGTKQPGEFRGSQNWVGRPGSTLLDADFVPPPPQHLGQLLGEFERFLHLEDQIPILLRVGMAEIGSLPAGAATLVEVNQRFGNTNPAFNTFRTPVTLTMMLRYDIARRNARDARAIGD